MNKKIPNIIAIGIVVFLAVVSGLLFLANDKSEQVAKQKNITDIKDNNQNQKIIDTCPDDAKVCPNGTTVARAEPNCEFAECPAVNKEKPNYPLLPKPVSNNGVKIEIILGKKYCSYEEYSNTGYQQSIKVLYADNNKKEKIIYTTSDKIHGREVSTYTESDCLFIESIGNLILSPDGKYLIFHKNAWGSKPYMINIDTEKYVFGDKNDIFIIRDILWSLNNKNFAITTDVNEMGGVGELGVYVSGYNNPDKIKEIWIAKNYLLADIKEVNFIGNEKISFNIEQKECYATAELCPDGTYAHRIGSNCEFEDCAIKNKATEAPKKILKYEYSFKENKLTQIN